MLLLCSGAASLRVGVCPGRAPPPVMGLFDGVKDAFGGGDKPASGGGGGGAFGGLKDALGGGDKPIVAEDRVTPFDRWLGLDKDLLKDVKSNPDMKTGSEVQFVDPCDAQNYFAIELPKPMGIAFVENDGDCGGVVVDDVLAEGSAKADGRVSNKDQLVGVDAALVLGADFDTARALPSRPKPAPSRTIHHPSPTHLALGESRSDTCHAPVQQSTRSRGQKGRRPSSPSFAGPPPSCTGLPSRRLTGTRRTSRSARRVGGFKSGDPACSQRRGMGVRRVDLSVRL